MHGTNPIRVQDLRNANALAIESVFLTVQGEGPFAGLPAIFIRLSGCWLKCHFCDTQFEEGINTRWPVASVVQQVNDLRGTSLVELVVLTGGDPLRQNILPLCQALKDAGYHVQIETAGIQWVPNLETLLARRPTLPIPGVSIVCSPKTGKVCPEVLHFTACWKYIIRAADVIDLLDGLPNSSTQTPSLVQRLARPPVGHPRSMVYLQPCDEEEAVLNKRNQELAVQLAQKYGYRVSLQQHKILGMP